MKCPAKPPLPYLAVKLERLREEAMLVKSKEAAP